ncbi:uncharacterized protein LOC127720715 [Mytilus californianus]|uniref:uncharacterized protein LOC127720715 n=1 Tax=Mytilus californianus TaxID=6549 RepID=UPI002245215B|nr:uncharacterized protein LOC127720715 [Mytilus californianus]
MELVVHVILSILVIFNSVQGSHRHTNGHQSILQQYNDGQGQMSGSRTRKHIFSYRNPNLLVESKPLNSGLKTGIRHRFSYANANREFPLPATRPFIPQKMKIVEAAPFSNVLKPNMKIAKSDIVKLNTNIAKTVPLSGISADPIDSLMRKNKDLVGSIEQLIVDALVDGPPAGNIDNSPSVGNIDNSPSVGITNKGPSVGNKNNGPYVGITNKHPSVGITNKGPYVGNRHNGPSIVNTNNGPFAGNINDTPYVVQKETKSVKKSEKTNVVKVKTVNKEAVTNKLGKTTKNTDTMGKNVKHHGKFVKDVIKSDLRTTKKINKHIDKKISDSNNSSQSVSPKPEKGEGSLKAGPKSEKVEGSSKAEPVEPTEAVRTEAPTTQEPVEPSGRELYFADEYCVCMTWCPPGTEYRGRCGHRWSYGLSTCCIPSYYGYDDDGDYD